MEATFRDGYLVSKMQFLLREYQALAAALVQLLLLDEARCLGVE